MIKSKNLKPRHLIVAFTLLASIIIAVPVIYGDVMISGTISGKTFEIKPVIELNNVTNVSYKGATFQWVPGNSIALDSSGTTSMSFTVTSSTTLYIGFLVDPDSNGGTFTVSMNLVAT